MMSLGIIVDRLRSVPLAGYSTTYAFIRNPATSNMLSCLVPSLGESQ